jgi:hypothetical protein
MCCIVSFSTVGVGQVWGRTSGREGALLARLGKRCGLAGRGYLGGGLEIPEDEAGRCAGEVGKGALLISPIHYSIYASSVVGLGDGWRPGALQTVWA